MYSGASFVCVIVIDLFTYFIILCVWAESNLTSKKSGAEHVRKKHSFLNNEATYLISIPKE